MAGAPSSCPGGGAPPRFARRPTEPARHATRPAAGQACFLWSARATELGCEDAGLYEVSVGVWPASKQLGAELRVNGAVAVVLQDAAAAALRQAAAAQKGGAARARVASEAAGLCAVTVLSLPAHATLAVAVENATSRTRSFLGLRKL